MVAISDFCARGGLGMWHKAQESEISAPPKAEEVPFRDLGFRLSQLGQCRRGWSMATGDFCPMFRV